MADNLVKFKSGTAAAFKALESKDNNTLYFLNDTYQIYKGNQIYTTDYWVGNTKPSTGAENTLYICTNEQKIYEWKDADEGGSYSVVFDGSTAALDNEVTESSTNGVTSKAIYEFVASEVAKITGGSTDAFVTSITADDEVVGRLNIQKGTTSTTVDLKLSGMAKLPSYDASSRKITFQSADGSEQAVEIDLGKDLVVQSGRYDTEEKKLILVLNDEDSTEIEIDVAALVDTYTASEDVTGAIQITVGSDNTIKGTILVDNSTIKIEDGKIKADFSNLVTKSELEALQTQVTQLETKVTNLTTTVTENYEELDGRIEEVEQIVADLDNDYVSKDYLTTNYYDNNTIDGKINAVNSSVTELTEALTWGSII